MSPCELISELLQGGRSLAEIAGYDDSFITGCLWLSRDETGRLIQTGEELPPWVLVDRNGQRLVANPQPLSHLFREVQRWRGVSAEGAEQAWQQWLERNPKCGRGGEELPQGTVRVKDLEAELRAKLCRAG